MIFPLTPVSSGSALLASSIYGVTRFNRHSSGGFVLARSLERQASRGMMNTRSEAPDGWIDALDFPSGCLSRPT